MLKAIVRWGVAWPVVIACLVGIKTPCAAADPETDTRRFQIEFETGAIWQGRNEIQIPDSAAGTRFSLVDIQDSTPIVQRRVEATWYLFSATTADILYAVPHISAVIPAA